MRRAPTPAERFVDGRGRPYFLWDVDLTLAEYREKLTSEDPEEAAYWLARAMRDAKPDDVFELVDWSAVVRAWPRVTRYLGRRHNFWRWWIARAGYAVDAQ